jgi:hypothetical protein
MNLQLVSDHRNRNDPLLNPAAKIQMI